MDQLLPSSLPIAVFVAGWLAVVNVTLAVFNLIPTFPMDGGRILRAFLARNRSYINATRTAAHIGELFALVIAIIGLLSLNIVLILVALFVYGAAVTESRVTVFSDLLEGVTAANVMIELHIV